MSDPYRAQVCEVRKELCRAVVVAQSESTVSELLQQQRLEQGRPTKLEEKI